MSSHEPESLKQLRRENLAGLSGRVLEVGAGTGTNFELYPDTVTEVVAVEPERRLSVQAEQAAAAASVPIRVSANTVEQFADAEPFDAAVCSLVLCSVNDPDQVVRQLFSALKPGGELRYFEHVASSGWRDRLQRFADATLWPRMAGNCHTHRHTEQTIVDAGFKVSGARREWVLPAWMPVPSSEVAIGRAVKP
jgi:SAM-dependent methyltransferase